MRDRLHAGAIVVGRTIGATARAARGVARAAPIPRAADALVLVPRAITRLTGAIVLALHDRGVAGPSTVAVAADVDTTLMASAAALRRLGARITRYDTDDAILEARLGTAHVAVRANAGGNEITRLDVSTDAPRAGRLVRHFKQELTRGAAAR